LGRLPPSRKRLVFLFVFLFLRRVVGKVETRNNVASLLYDLFNDERT
jgi:hypothetical protein